MITIKPASGYGSCQLAGQSFNKPYSVVLYNRIYYASNDGFYLVRVGEEGQSREVVTVIGYPNLAMPYSSGMHISIRREDKVGYQLTTRNRKKNNPPPNSESVT